MEDVDHAVVLLDEEHQVAQCKDNPSYHAELGSIDNFASQRDWKYSDDERFEKQKEMPPTEKDLGEDGVETSIR